MVLTAMIAIQRFNKSLIGDEGYLMFTLPVTHTQLLNSKLIASLLWVVVGTIVMGLASLIIFVPVFLAVPDMDWAYFWNCLLYTSTGNRCLRFPISGAIRSEARGMVWLSR